MAHYHIRSQYAPDWKVAVGDCTAEHAESVARQLAADTLMPEALYVERIHDGEVIFSEPKVEQKRRWWQRFRG